MCHNDIDQKILIMSLPPSKLTGQWDNQPFEDVISQWICWGISPLSCEFLRVYISHQKSLLKMSFPIPKVGYVSSLENETSSSCLLVYKSRAQRNPKEEERQRQLAFMEGFTPPGLCSATCATAGEGGGTSEGWRRGPVEVVEMGIRWVCILKFQRCLSQIPFISLFFRAALFSIH